MGKTRFLIIVNGKNRLFRLELAYPRCCPEFVVLLYIKNDGLTLVIKKHTWNPLAKVLECVELVVAVVILFRCGGDPLRGGGPSKVHKKRWLDTFNLKNIPGIHWRRSLSASNL
jgi:hypothetical protein